MTDNKQQVWRVSIDTRNEPDGAIHNGITLVDATNEEDAKKQAIAFMNSIGIEPVKVHFAEPHGPYAVLAEAEDNSIGASMYQDKSIAEWEKLFKKDFGFTQEQIFKLVKSGVDLGRMLQGLDEAGQDIDDKALFKDEQFFFNENRNLDEMTDEEAAFDEDGYALNEEECEEINESFKSLSEDIKSNIATFSAGVAAGNVLGQTKNGQSANPNNLIGPAAMLMATASANKDMATTGIMQKAFTKMQAASTITDAQLCLLALIFEAGENGIVWPEIKKMLKDAGKTRIDIRREMRNLINGDLVDEDFNLFTRNVYHITRRGKKVLAQNGYDSAKMRALSDIVKKNIEDYDKDQNININVHESTHCPEDVVTVGDLIKCLRVNAKLDDKAMFRVNKAEALLFDVHSKGGTAVIDIVPSANAKRFDENEKEKAVNEAITYEQWQEAAKWFGNNGYDLEDDEVRQEEFAPQGDQFLFKPGKSPTGKDEVVDGIKAFKLYKSLKEGEEMKATNEGRGWYGGGYGGTGRSWKSLGGRGPRGAEIGWYAVADLDPKAKGKMPGWRCGPSNFPFTDLFFPNRKYKVGTMVMRNKYVNAGSLSGEIYIAVPSYFAIVRSKNPEGIAVLENLGIPLDLTFGMDPNDDYSMTYTEK